MDVGQTIWLKWERFRLDSDSPETIPIFQPTSQLTSKLLAENNSLNHYECKQNAQYRHIANEPCSATSQYAFIA